MSDEVLDPTSDAPDNRLTIEALSDPGWASMSMLVRTIADQIFDGEAAIAAIPDPEGYAQMQTGKEKWAPGLFVTIASTSVEGLEASLVFPYEIETLPEIRPVMIDMFMRLRAAEVQAAERAAGPKLVVPKKELLVPGRNA